MDIKITIGGIDAVVTVKDATEAVSLLSSIAAAAKSSPPPPDNSFSGVPQGMRNTEPADKPVQQVPDGDIREALEHLAGSEAAKLLKTIADYPDGCNNTELLSRMTEKYNWERDANMGPILSNISKSCKRSGFTVDVILAKYRKRLSKGRMAYYFVVKEPARSIIRSIAGYDKSADFPGLAAAR